MNWKLIRLIDAYLGIPLLCALLGLRRLLSPLLRPRSRGGARRILLVKFWGIGNLFMMLPAVRSLREAHPAAELELLTLGTNREAAEATQAFTAVHTIETSGTARFLATSLRQMAALRRKRYDVIIDFEQFARFSALFCAVMGSGRTIGFRTQGQRRHFLYDRSVSYDNTVHITRSYQALAVAAGGSDALMPPQPVPQPDGGARQALFDRLSIPRDRMVVVLHAGTSDNFAERRWPVRHYAVLADLLIEHHDATIVLTGLHAESALAAGVRSAVRRRDRVVDVSGMLTFAAFHSLICMSDLVVSSDTAPVHLASAAGTPVVGLYGPNTPLLYGPWGGNGMACYRRLACSPCITNFNAKTHVCRHPDGRGACMQHLLPGEVYRSIRERYLDPAAAAPVEQPSGLASCTV